MDFKYDVIVIGAGHAGCEAAAAAAAQAEADKKAAALARSENTEKLLTEIRDLLKEGK